MDNLINHGGEMQIFAQVFSSFSIQSELIWIKRGGLKKKKRPRRPWIVGFPPLFYYHAELLLSYDLPASVYATIIFLRPPKIFFQIFQKFDWIQPKFYFKFSKNFSKVMKIFLKFWKIFPKFCSYSSKRFFQEFPSDFL